MPGSSSNNNSFIPKRGTTGGAKRKAVSRQVYIFTISSYVLLFATLLATGGIFLYENHLKSQRDEAISQLHTDITSFSRADMEELQMFDRYLAQAYGRLNKSVSMASIFSAIEAATIDTVMIDALELEREDDARYLLSATVKTDSFDSTIFQRKVFENNTVVETVVVDEVRAAASQAEGQSGLSDSTNARLTFTAELGVPLSAVPYIPGAGQPSITRSVVVPPVEALNQSATATDDVLSDSNETAI